MKFYQKSPYDKKKIKIEVKSSDIVIPRDAKTILEVALINHKAYLKDKLGFSDDEVERYLEYKICSMSVRQKANPVTVLKNFGIGMLIPSIFSLIYWYGHTDMKPIQFTFIGVGVASLMLSKLFDKSKRKNPYYSQYGVIDGISSERMGKAEVSYDACYKATKQACKEKKLKLQ